MLDGRIRKFTDLKVWQEAHVLTLLIYNITSKFPESEKYNLTSQLRRAAVSAESCIAEGFSRYHYKERLQFYFDSRGSIAEIQSQLFISYDLKFIYEKGYKKVNSQSETVAVILGGLIRETQKRIGV